MPKAKNKKPHPHGVPMAIVMMVAIVFLLTLALLFAWNLFPHPPAYVPPVATSTIPVVPAIPVATTTKPVVQPATPIRPAPVGMVCDSLNFICIDPSFANATLTSPFVATGTAIAFENQFSWHLFDGKGQELDEGMTMTNATDAGQPGEFQIREFLLTVPSTATGTLELHEHSAKDGSEIHVVRVPVKFPSQTMSVRDVCRSVNVSVQIIKTKLPIEAALTLMLRKEFKLTTGIDSLELNNGVLSVFVEPDLVNDAIPSCIEATAKQFSSVKKVDVVLDMATS
jgi:hypothetical protein